jgi:hypothetical protein
VVLIYRERAPFQKEPLAPCIKRLSQGRFIDTLFLFVCVCASGQKKWMSSGAVRPRERTVSVPAPFLRAIIIHHTIATLGGSNGN